MSQSELSLDGLRQRVAEVAADKRREAELEVEVRRLRAAYDAALRNAVLAKGYGDHCTPAAYRRHDEAWQWAEAVEAERADVWSPFGKCWR